MERIPAAKMAKQISNILRHSRPDYIYVCDVFKRVRNELGIKKVKQGRKLPYVPTDEELSNFYEVVWRSKNLMHALMIKVMTFTGVRSAELVKIKILDVDLNACQIRITDGKGGKDRTVPFPPSFKESLAIHIDKMRRSGAQYLFESNRKTTYSTVALRKMVAKYSEEAKLSRTLSPHKFRHYLFTYLKKKGLDDSMIQPYSGHESRKSLEVYSRLSLSDVQEKYTDVIGNMAI